MSWGPKDPEAIRDYGINWSADLNGSTIVQSSWKLDGIEWPVSPALTKVAQSHSTTATVIRIGGGTVGETYLVTNHIVLANGEEDEFSVKLKIKER